MSFANVARDGVKTYSMRSKGENYQLSTNFQLGEFQSNDGADTVMVHPDLITALQKLRDLVGGPINVHSGYRTQSHHRAIYDAMNAERRAAGKSVVPIPWQSAHLFGMGADISSPVASVEKLAYLARYEVGMGGVAMYISDDFVHVDIERVRTWADGVPPSAAGGSKFVVTGTLLALGVGGILAYKYNLLPW